MLLIKPLRLLPLAALIALAACKDDKKSAPMPTFYTIIFDSQGGSAVLADTVEQGKTAAEPRVPRRTGFAFLGWYTNAADANSKFDFAATPITAHLTLYARWVEGYTVTLERKSRGLAQQLVVEKGKPMAEPPAAIGFFSASDVDFGGWYADEGFQTEFDFTQPITTDTVLYAQAIYLISTEGQLRTALQGAEGSYRLVADIALTAGSLWNPIGDEFEPFNGHFEGQGHIISNLTINSRGVGVGLFGVVGPQGRVEAVGVQVAEGGITGSPSSVGALAGENRGYVSGYATGGKVTGFDDVGGLVGHNSGAVVGYAAVEVEGYGVVGGLVGRNSGQVTGYVVGNATGGRTVDLAPRSSLESLTGGLVGYAYNRYNNSNATGYTRGKITRRPKDPNSTHDTFTLFGLLVGYPGSVTGYHSGKAGESQFVGITVAERQGEDGGAIDYTATTKPTASDFSNLTFGDKPGEWTWVDGRWPSINLEAPVDQSAVTAP